MTTIALLVSNHVEPDKQWGRVEVDINAPKRKRLKWTPATAGDMLEPGANSSEQQQPSEAGADDSPSPEVVEKVWIHCRAPSCIAVVIEIFGQRVVWYRMGLLRGNSPTHKQHPRVTMACHRQERLLWHPRPCSSSGKPKSKPRCVMTSEAVDLCMLQPGPLAYPCCSSDICA